MGVWVDEGDGREVWGRLGGSWEVWTALRGRVWGVVFWVVWGEGGAEWGLRRSRGDVTGGRGGLVRRHID